jgi:hypothetical protein
MHQLNLCNGCLLGLVADCVVSSLSVMTWGQCIPEQISKLIAADSASSDFAGYSVAIDGDTAVVGAPREDHGAFVDAGAAYVFVRSGPPENEVWTQQAKLTAGDGATSDQFGASVDIDGDTVVVGANLDDFSGKVDAGSAYVFVRTGVTWTQQAKLIAGDGANGDAFGLPVAISGNTVIASAFQDDLPGKPDAGSSYIFVRTGDPGREAWTQQAKLIAFDGVGLDFFGPAVAIQGDTAVVGVPPDDTGGGANAGSAYVFVRSGATWTTQAKLTASDASAIDQFGSGVAIDGDTVIVGANFDDPSGFSNAGSAYIYVRTGPPESQVWTQQAKIVASDPGADDFFGNFVAIEGDTAVVTSAGDDFPGKVDAGSAYVFVRKGPPGSETWTQTAKVNAADSAGGDTFGVFVDVSEGTMIAGAWHDDFSGKVDAGSAYIFRLNCEEPLPGDLDDDGVIGSADLGVLLGAWGSGLAAADLNSDGTVDGADLGLLLRLWSEESAGG